MDSTGSLRVVASIHSGPGILTGTTEVAIEAGVASFSGTSLSCDLAGSYALVFSTELTGGPAVAPVTALVAAVRSSPKKLQFWNQIVLAPPKNGRV